MSPRAPKTSPNRRDVLALGVVGVATLATATFAVANPFSRRTTMLASEPESQTTPRQIVHTTRGRGGVINRLMSPSDLGQLIKPFVFLDLVNAPKGRPGPPMQTGWHPHSGIATVTVLFDGELQYAETTGHTGVLPAGGVEWMKAGGGVWHTGTSDGATNVRGFQLWVALPPEEENAPSASHYVAPEELGQVGPASVVLGEYQGVTSPIAAPPMNYLAVRLEDGERWTYQPPPGHDVGWFAVIDGQVDTPTPITAGTLAILEESEDAITFVAKGPTRFVLGSGSKHPFDLALGHYSVHTSQQALREGEDEIRRIGRTLTAAGKRSYALQHFG